MENKEYEDRLRKLEVLRESHLQDVEELGMVIEGLKKMIKLTATPNK